MTASHSLRKAAAPLAEAFVWLLLLTLWAVHSVEAKDSFRLPKQVIGEGLVLASLLLLAVRWWRSEQVLEPARLLRLPVLRALLPLLLVASLGLFTSDHPLHVRDALGSLWIGAAALVGWSLGLPRARLLTLVRGLIWPALALAVVAALQFHGLWRPFDFVGQIETERLGVTSFAGSTADLAMLLLLPCLVAQERLWSCRGRQQLLWGAALAVCLYAMVASQTVSVLGVLVVCSLLLWLLLLPRRRALALAAGGLVLGTVLVAAVPPLRERAWPKVQQLARGDLDAALTGRLDGWKAAVWMLRQEPLTGVGHGAYRPEFAPAKLALAERGVKFFAGHYFVIFANAHNEYLEVGAEWGVPGLAVLAWALWCLFDRLRRRPAPAVETALAWAGTAALALIALVQFPLRMALVAYPIVLWLAWLFASDPDGGSAPAAETPPRWTIVAWLVLGGLATFAVVTVQEPSYGGGEWLVALAALLASWRLTRHREAAS